MKPFAVAILGIPKGMLMVANAVIDAVAVIRFLLEVTPLFLAEAIFGNEDIFGGYRLLIPQIHPCFIRFHGTV